MASSEAFIPVATEEPQEYAVPMYTPDGPGDVGGSSQFGVASGNAVSSPPAPGSGRVHLYFNYCCDCRRAVLAVNAISITWNLIMLIVFNVYLNYMGSHPDQIESNMSEEEAQKFDQFAKGGQLQFVEALIDAFTFVAIFMHACGIFGALKFKKWGIAVAGSAYAVSFTLNLLSFNVPNMILAGALGYPHYFLIKEINEGIMTDYNYHNVASCCGGA